MGQAGDVATLGRVGGFGGFLGFLQLLVGALVRFDFLHQQVGLAARFLLRHVPAFAGQDNPPGEQGGEHREGQKGLEKRQVQGLHCIAGILAEALGNLAVDQREGAEQQADDDRQYPQVMGQAGVQARDAGVGQHPANQVVELLGQPRPWFTQVVAARIQRTTQRADWCAVGGAEGHVFHLETIAAQHAGNLFLLHVWVEQLARALPGNVETPAGEYGQQRRDQQG